MRDLVALVLKLLDLMTFLFDIGKILGQRDQSPRRLLDNSCLFFKQIKKDLIMRYQQLTKTHNNLRIIGQPW